MKELKKNEDYVLTHNAVKWKQKQPLLNFSIEDVLFIASTLPKHKPTQSNFSITYASSLSSEF